MPKSPSGSGEMFPGIGAPGGCVVVNERCLVRTEDGRRVVLVSGLAMAQYEVGDACSEAHAMVGLVNKCEAPHLLTYVERAVMWRSDRGFEGQRGANCTLLM